MQIKAHILQEFKAGQIDRFYHEVYPSLLTYALHNLSEDDAFLGEDCVQDAIFEAYCRRDKFDSPAQFKSFLYKCVYSKIVTLHRKNQSYNNYREQSDDLSYDMLHAILEQETLDLLYAAIDSLPDDLRQVLELSFGEGLKNAEVAARMNISESAVKKKKIRMLAMLRNILGDEATMQLVLLILTTLVRSRSGC
ncbi:MAG: RNA polymerase sigma factor [Bacteroides sp.]|nr:RNA polymerase sigma factor [Roseburia sp.]MCM1347011.1 RNA polymerase sigma factor [Bacteroides sp.]MCM1421530.1 RNA polymerase sigma factor [Bacteroides sp.]